MKSTFYYCVFAVAILAGCSKKETTVSAHKNSEAEEISSDTSGQNDELIDFAEAIIARATQIADYIPNKDAQSVILQGLKLMQINFTEGDGALQIPAEQSVTLAISNEQILTQEGSVTLFAFQFVEYQKTKHTIIRMNQNIREYSTNIDILATALIHEFLHMMQTNAEMNGAKKISAYEGEVRAWQSQAYLVAQLYPEIKNIEYDCNTMQVLPSTPEQVALTSDYLIREMVAFLNCGHLYLKGIYTE